MAPLAVDPEALDGAGATVISVGESLGSVVSTLTTALTGCDGMAGDDPAGSTFGRTYNTSASKLLQAMATTRNGLCRLGDGVRMSAHNYSVAEAMSNVSGHSQPLPGPHPTGSISAGSAPSAVGSGVGAPAGWGWVAKYIGMIWPNGDSTKLRAAAAAWTSAGTNFEVGEILGAAGPMGSIGAQQIPEAAAITAAFADANRSAAGILQQCNTIAIQLSTLASKIDSVHAAILDLLSRICDPMTGIKEVWEFLTDEDEDEIKKIANDIRIIVNQFTSEVEALSQQIATALTEATTILTTMSRYAEREWDQFLHHTDVGRALNQVGQFGKGVGEEIGGLLQDGWTYGPMREFVDPQGFYQSWKELVGGMAPLVGLGGDHAPGVAQAWKDLGKNAVHWDEWSTNPAEAAGKSTFDIATLFIPGGGEAAAAAKGAHAASDAAEAATAASRGEAAAARGLSDAAVPHAPAPAPHGPHPETPPPARPSPPSVDRPPPPTERPVTPAPTKPASAPADVPAPHGPTESKPPLAEGPGTGAQPRSAPPADSAHPQAFEPTTTHPAAVPDGPAGPTAGADPAPHAPMTDLSPPSSHPSPPHDGGASGGHGGGHGDGLQDGDVPRGTHDGEPGDGHHGNHHNDTPDDGLDGLDGQPDHRPNHEVNADAEHLGASKEPQHQLTNGEPVNVATGEYLLATVDIDLAGTLPLRLTRRHRSQFRHGLWFGPTWVSTFDSRAVITASGVTTIDSEGTMLVFNHPAPDVPCAPRHGQGWVLHAESSGGYRLDDARGVRSVHFTPLPQLAGADVDAGVIAASTITDRNENRIDFIYNEIGVPVRIEHSGGYTVDVTCGGGRIRGYTVAGRRIRRFDYTQGDLTSVENGVGAVTRFSYDDAHRMVSWTDSIGGQYNNTYDPDGRVVSQTGTGGIWAATFDYRNEDDGRSTVFADALGRSTTYHFDDDLRPNVVTDPTGCATHTTFAGTLDPLTLTNAAGGTTSYRYGDDNRLEQMTDPLGHVLAFTYADGMPTQMTGPDGGLTRYEYDERGNLNAVYDCTGAMHRWQRDESGSVRAYVDPAGRRTEIGCSPAGLPIRIVDALGNETQISYDDFGRPISVTHADGTSTVTTYDAEGRRASRLTADGFQELWTYDGEGNCVAFTNGAGAITRWEYGYYDLVTARVDADGARTEYGYNAARQLISVTNPAGLVWWFNYRADGLLVAETDFNGATTTYAYDSAGRLASRTNAAGQTVSYTYDLAGNVLTESSSAATGIDDDLAEEQISYEYDAAGRRISASSPAGRLDLMRDPVGRVIGETWNGRTVVNIFNAAGDLLEIQTPSGLPSRFSYDARGVAESLTVDGRPCEVTTDALGRPTKYRYGTVEVDSVWDQMSRLAARSVSANEVAELGSAKYSYRADGALTNANHSGIGAALCTVAGYDADITGKLIATTLPDGSRRTFHFDASQNLSTRGNERCQYRGVLLVDDGRSRYGYDQAGRLTTVSTRRLGRKPDVWQYKWDAWDRLRALVTPDGATFHYTYDPLGRRVAKEGSDRTRTDFCWSQTRMIEQVATAADAKTSVTSWSYLPGELTPQIQVSQDDVDREFFALVTDQVGSPIAVLDPRTETLAGQSHTSEWGQARWNGVSTPWRFPGQYHDEESGLHYNFHRYYDPGAGRYISPDPLGLAPAPNPYGYPTNPTGWVDPLGLNPCQGGPPGSQVLHHYGPHETGPLPLDLVDTFRSGTYTEMVTKEPITLYRAYTQGASPVGGFWSRDIPMGPMQTQMDSALNPAWGNQATAVSKIEVPAGTTFFEGIVGPQPIAGGGILLGGGDQIVFTPGFRVPMDWLR